MCGIAGIVQLNNRDVNVNDIHSMMSAMKYRGPDDDGYIVDKNVGLGFVRLSILDLSLGGHQPMLSQDGKNYIVFNGEIYNYIELKSILSSTYSFKTNTDTEVILAAYDKWGEKCLDYFNGMFAFAIYSTESKNVFLARDRYGIKPLYYFYDETVFIFASDIPPILKIRKNINDADYQSIYDFLILNRTNYSQNTFFKNIKKVKHAQKIVISNNRIIVRPWYDLQSKVAASEPFKNSSEFKEQLIDSINLRLRSDVPVGTCLSGGLDSSTITSLILDHLNKPDLHTFSSIFQKGQKGDESDYIMLYKNIVKNMHFTKPSCNSLLKDLDKFIEALVEPVPTTSEYSEYKVMELAKSNCTVLLSGQGADEELAGYKYFFGYHFKDLLFGGNWLTLIKELYYYTKKNKTNEGFKSFVFSLLPRILKENKSLLKKSYLSSEFFHDYKVSPEITNLYEAENLNQFLLNHFKYKLEHHLSWADRSGMWFSIETRFPFLDHRIVERILSQNSKDLINNGVDKMILRKSMDGTVPAKILKRKEKIGFETPEDIWFREPKFQDLVMDIISSKKFKNRGIYNHKKIVGTYNNHLKGKCNAGKEVWKWIHLELWFRQYIDIN